MRGGYFYLLVNRKNGVIYAGSTNDFRTRNDEHKRRANPQSFAAQHGCDKLVYIEHYDDMRDAIARENAVKRYKRSWKIALIEKDNPDWFDIKLDPLD